MSRQQWRLTPTSRSCSSPERTEKPNSGSSRNSSSPIHWDAITGNISKNIRNIKPSSWDNSDDELPLPLDNSKSHIYSSESQVNRKSVTAEINELKKQFFELAITEDVEDLEDRSELFLGSDRRQSPARVRRRSKSSSSSSTVMDGGTQNSPKQGDDLISHELLFKHMDNFAPLLELNSKYYLDNFFAELRRKRISMLDSSAFDNERFDNDFQENLMEDEFTAYYTRTSRKLSQILEVEENKKDSDKDVEEYPENGDLFLKLSRKSERSNSSVETALNKKDRILFERINEEKTSNIGNDISRQSKQTTPTDKSSTVNDEIISLTSKTAKIHINVPRNDQEIIESLNLPNSENPTPRKTSRRSSRSGSRKSTRDVALQSPKFIINLGKDSGRSLKLEDVKTPHSTGKSSATGSERPLKEYVNSRRSEQEPDKNIPDIRTPSLISDRSLELQDISLDQGMNSNRYGETSHRSEFSPKSPMGSEQSSKTSRTARSYRSSKLHSQRNELERPESRKSSVTSRADADDQINTPRLDNYTSRSRGESRKSSLREMQTKTRTNSSSNVSMNSKITLDDFENENVPDWVQQSSRSDVINTESFDKASQIDSVDDCGSANNSSRKLNSTEHLDNPDLIASSRSLKKSRSNSCSSERTLNIEKSDDVKSSGRSTDRIACVEECESVMTQRSKNDSESDRRLSVINEVSYEDIAPESSKPSITSDRINEKIPKHHPTSYRSIKNESKNSPTRPKSEGMWNELIETFSEDHKQPFSWEDNFTNFLKRESGTNSGREAITPVKEDRFFKFENGEKDECDFVVSEKLREINKKVPSPGKQLEKKENSARDLVTDSECHSKEKMITDSDPQNLYYFKVEKTGSFGIGEFGDVTCWNLGTYEFPGEGKPKDHGDGIQSVYPFPTPILNQENCEKEHKTQRKLLSNLKDFHSISKAPKSYRKYDDSRPTFLQTDLKPSKSDNCINTNEFNQLVRVDFPVQKLSNRENNPLVFENPGNRKRKAEPTISSMKYSSSECGSDDTDNQEFECERVRRATSLTDIAAELRRTGYENPDSSENLYASNSQLFEKIRVETKDTGTTNLNVFLARKKQEDKVKSNWLTIKQKTSHRENKKSKSRLQQNDKNLVKNNSKEYLSFRRKDSVPMLKLKDRNCFQNFYKRVISVFCLTPNSSLPTSK